MKKLSILIAVVTIVSNAAFAKIWRVNNNPGVNADFTTLQAAHNGAAAGDTIYLESSATSYGGLNSSKKLAIIGTGYFLGQNQELQAFTLPSTVGQIVMSAGSSGSVLQGLNFNGSNLYVDVNDIVVQRNFFGVINGNNPDSYYPGTLSIRSNASNILVSQNFALSLTVDGSSIGLLFSNNYFTLAYQYGDATTQNSVNLSSAAIAILKNNIFRRGQIIAYNSNISNNIMYAGFLGGSGNLISNNIGNSTQFGTADGNKSNVDMSTVFELTGSFDAAWKLKVGSPAIGAGYGSTVPNPVDCGIYGGSTAYVLSGIPAIPSIYFFANQPVGSNSDPIKVQIKVKSNN
jgi:hypothetical protein